MARLSNDRLIAAIDVGTTKICALIAQDLGQGQVEIVGIGRSPSLGLRKGVVVDIGKTVHAIRSAIHEAELMAGVPIESVGVGVSGSHISALNSHGVVPIKRGVVGDADIASVLAAARAVVVAEGRQILHVIPQYYIIDGQDRIQDPRGMHGIRLEVCAHIILGAVACVQNVISCCQMAGVAVGDIVLEQLASAAAVLTKDELELGVAVLDIGGGTADLAVYQNGSIRHTMVLPIAGNHFTNDLAIGLHTTLEEAERVKKRFGMNVNDQDYIEVSCIDQESMQRVHAEDVQMIVESRAHELLMFVRRELQHKSLMPLITTGIVLTGGGSLLSGMKELAQEVFDKPVRIGVPRIESAIADSLSSPIYATGYGLLVHMAKGYERSLSGTDGSLVNRVFERMRSWITDVF